MDDSRIASDGWEAMNTAVADAETIVSNCLCAGNGFLHFTHWALNLCQCRVDFNVRVPNRGVHLLVGRRKGFRLQDAPEILIDGSHHLYRHARSGVLSVPKGFARDGRAAHIVCVGIRGWVVISRCGRLALAPGILGA